MTTDNKPAAPFWNQTSVNQWQFYHSHWCRTLQHIQEADYKRNFRRHWEGAIWQKVVMTKKVECNVDTHRTSCELHHLPVIRSQKTEWKQVREHSRLCGTFEARLGYTVKPWIHVQANYHRPQKWRNHWQSQCTHVCVFHMCIYTIYMLKYKEIS